MSRPIAVVTGASSGIGREFARLLAEAGYDLVVVARRSDLLSELAASLTKTTGCRVWVRSYDLSSPEACESFAASLGEMHSDIDVLINNAGFGLRGPFAALPPGEQLELLRLNVLAVTHLTRLFLPGMIRRGRGRILNMASTSAFQPGPHMAVYYASKAYVLSLSEALHEEVRRQGVTVTALCPSSIDTEFQRRAGAPRRRPFPGKPMTAEAVARAGLRAMMRGRSCVVPGAWNAVLAFSTRLIPRQWSARIARRLQPD
jgi:short-subunit dehydrogenase